MAAQDIRDKIATLKAYGDTFEYVEETQGQTYTHLLSVFNDNDSRYFIDYLHYYIEKRGGAEHCCFREIATHTDRSFFLELVNSLIDNRKRKELFYALIGKRQFSQHKSPLLLYLDRPVDSAAVAAHIKAQRKVLRKSEAHAITKKMGKNLNIYEVFVFAFNDRHFAWMDQKNISNFKKEERAFLLELDVQEADRFKSTPNAREQIERLFFLIGTRVVEQIPFAEAKTLQPHLEASVLQEEFLERVSAHELLDKLSDIADSPLLAVDERDGLKDGYLELYAVAVRLIVQEDHLQRLKTGRQLADQLEAFAGQIAQEAAFYLLSALLLKLANHLRESQEAIELLRDISNAELLADALEFMQRWMETLFSADAIRIAYATVDLVNDLTFVASLLAPEEEGS
jgi:hypothetical protein